MKGRLYILVVKSLVLESKGPEFDPREDFGGEGC